MKYAALLLVWGCFSLTLQGEDKVVPVFVSGTEGYRSFRIPALIALPNGELLAFCEGRVNGANDYGNIDMVMKRSTDRGQTWSPLQVVAEFGDLQLGNPAPVVDLTDPTFPQGRIFLFYNTGNNHESEILKGHGIKSCWYKTSIDNGATWSAPVDITVQVHRPHQPTVNSAYNFTEDWRCIANTPGDVISISTASAGRESVVRGERDSTAPRRGRERHPVSTCGGGGDAPHDGLTSGARC